MRLVKDVVKDLGKDGKDVFRRWVLSVAGVSGPVPAIGMLEDFERGLDLCWDIESCLMMAELQWRFRRIARLLVPVKGSGFVMIPGQVMAVEVENIIFGRLGGKWVCMYWVGTRQTYVYEGLDFDHGLLFFFDVL